MKDDQEKWVWLRQRLVEFISHGSVLVFVTRKINSEEVATSLRGEGHKGTYVGYTLWVWPIHRPHLLVLVGLLHGDMTQGDRDSVITAFKKKEFPTLVATDVAGEDGGQFM
jgi:ATP-dependent RNA helicase DDX42